MSYPSPPDFAAVGPDEYNPPAWWSYTREDGSVNVCATTGGTLLRLLRTRVGLPGAAWDDSLATILSGRARQLAAQFPSQNWAPVIAALDASRAARQVTPAALGFAIWTAIYQPSGLRFDALQIPAGARMPPWNTTLSDGPGAGAGPYCFDPAREGAPLSVSALQTARAESLSGVRLHPGESLPVPVAPVPPGPAGLSTGMVVALVAGVIGIGVLALAASSGRPASSPTSRRRRNRGAAR